MSQLGVGMYSSGTDPIKMGKPGSETVSHTTLKLLYTCSSLARQEALTPRYNRSCDCYYAPSNPEEPHNILISICLLIATQCLIMFLSGFASTGPTYDVFIPSGFPGQSLPLDALWTDYPEGGIILTVPSASPEEKHLRAGIGQNGGG